MKRGTPNHPKTLALASALNVERWGAVGLLESLWHFTAHYARRGDIGRHGDAAIAAGIGWSGDAQVLISALVSCGWLDACSCHRLRVHDWDRHADQAVQKTQDVRNQGFIGCYETESGRISEGYPPDSGGLPSAGTGTGTGTGTGNREQGNGRNDGEKAADPFLDAAREVFAYWRYETGRKNSQWSSGREATLRARLKEEPGDIAARVAGLKLAVDGAVADPFFNGAETGRSYLDFDNIFRNRGRERIEKLQRLAQSPERTKGGDSRADRIDRKVLEGKKRAAQAADIARRAAE